jgi:hypothetical protein
VLPISYTDISDPPDLDGFTVRDDGFAADIKDLGQELDALLPVSYTDIADPPDLDDFVSKSKATPLKIEDDVYLVGDGDVGSWGNKPGIVSYKTTELRLHGHAPFRLSILADGDAQFGGDDANGLKIGSLGFDSTYSLFGLAHHDCFNTTDYALLHGPDGRTYLNCKAGDRIVFREGNATKMAMKDGRLGIGWSDWQMDNQAKPAKMLDVNGDFQATNVNSTGDITKTYNGTERFKVDYNGSVTMAGDLVKTYNGVERIKTDYNGRIIGVGGPYFEITANGPNQRLSLASQNEHIALYSPSNKNIYHWANFQNVSDDRLKWDEAPIATETGINVLNQLRPATYWKGNKIDVEPIESERRWEAGFIAQEVEQIPELQHAVAQVDVVDGKYFDGMYTLNYGQIQPYHVAATQELYKLVQDLTVRLAALEAR